VETQLLIGSLLFFFLIIFGIFTIFILKNFRPTGRLKERGEHLSLSLLLTFVLLLQSKPSTVPRLHLTLCLWLLGTDQGGSCPYPNFLCCGLSLPSRGPTKTDRAFHWAQLPHVEAGGREGWKFQPIPDVQCLVTQ
jgi:hypothetical protein